MPLHAKLGNDVIEAVVGDISLMEDKDACSRMVYRANLRDSCGTIEVTSYPIILTPYNITLATTYSKAQAKRNIP
jgi:hypothetical protein